MTHTITHFFLLLLKFVLISLVLVLLTAHAERLGVSHMQDFFDEVV